MRAPFSQLFFGHLYSVLSLVHTIELAKYFAVALEREGGRGGADLDELLEGGAVLGEELLEGGVGAVEGLQQGVGHHPTPRLRRHPGGGGGG